MPILALLFLIPATVVAVYYAVLTTVGWKNCRRGAAPSPRTTFAVVIPAHDEEEVLGSTLSAVAACDYPPDRVSVLVVADNCADRTAAVATAHGAACVERFDAALRGKGYALAFAIPHALAARPDAVLILDADCRLEPGALRALAAELAAGADAVQAAVTMGDPTAGPAGVVMAVGSEIENGVQAGLSRCGGTVRLRGTGMAFRREVLDRHPWQTFGLAEDAEYGAVLRRAGIRVRFVPDAVVRNTPPAGVADLCQQRERWRAALFVAGAGLFDRLTTSKPLILAHLAVTVLVVAFASAEFFAWSLTLVGLTGLVYARAIRRAGVPPRAALGLWRTPAIVARLAWVTAGGLVSRGGAWVRTPRVA
jgi:cellulose synthase/poly-beta-1,6-N-acetylglucosamine synthase-like glycosyltransferase